MIGLGRGRLPRMGLRVGGRSGRMMARRVMARVIAMRMARMVMAA